MMQQSRTSVTAGLRNASGSWPWQVHVTRALSAAAQQVAVANALQSLAPVMDLAAHEPLADCFNWQRVAEELRDEALHWYVVAFRSRRRPEADLDCLHLADVFAHLEARTSGGLLAYCYGDTSVPHSGVAMCVWAHERDAKRASQNPLHRRAADMAAAMYDAFTLERYHCTKPAGAKHFAFVPAAPRLVFDCIKLNG